MKHQKNIFLCILLAFMLAGCYTASAQVLYATAFDPATGQVRLFKIDVATCEMCPISNLSPPSPFSITGADIVVLPNGNILSINQSDGTYLFDPPNNTPIASFPTQWFEGAIVAPNGTVYLSGNINNGLYTFNSSNNTFSFIGSWPPNINVGEMFYWNGVLYGNGFDFSTGQEVLVQIDVANPSQSTIVQNTILNVASGTASIVSGTGQGIYHITSAFPFQQLSLYDIPSNSFSLVCDLTVFPYNSVDGLASLPSGVPAEPCLCITNAGTVTAGAETLCIPDPALVPYNNNATLDNNDLLRYILFSDPNNLPGSIVATSNTPNIAYNPATMQPNVVYYLGTMAGNNLNGNVDLTDPCLDFSNANATVIWRPRPTVAFSVSNTNVCVGTCKTLNVTFTGTAPFTLTYTNPATGDITQTFAGNNGTVEICPPPGTPSGNLVVSATALLDAWCSCI
jgi:hypothetical protein